MFSRNATWSSSTIVPLSIIAKINHRTNSQETTLHYACNEQMSSEQLEFSSIFFFSSGRQVQPQGGIAKPTGHAWRRAGSNPSQLALKCKKDDVCAPLCHTTATSHTWPLAFTLLTIYFLCKCHTSHISSVHWG